MEQMSANRAKCLIKFPLCGDPGDEFLLDVALDIQGKGNSYSESKLRAISSAGRASALHAEGQRFDPAIVHSLYSPEAS
jgi:hypothetical protein